MTHIVDPKKYESNRREFLQNLKKTIEGLLTANDTTIKTKKGRMLSKSIMLAVYSAVVEDPALYVAILRNGDPEELVNWIK